MAVPLTTTSGSAVWCFCTESFAPGSTLCVLTDNGGRCSIDQTRPQGGTLREDLCVRGARPLIQCAGTRAFLHLYVVFVGNP